MRSYQPGIFDVFTTIKLIIITEGSVPMGKIQKKNTPEKLWSAYLSLCFTHKIFLTYCTPRADSSFRLWVGSTTENGGGGRIRDFIQKFIQIKQLLRRWEQVSLNHVYNWSSYIFVTFLSHQQLYPVVLLKVKIQDNLKIKFTSRVYAVKVCEWLLYGVVTKS